MLSTPNEIRGDSAGARLAKRARMTNNAKTQMSSVKEILASLGDVDSDHPEKLSLRFRYFKLSCWCVGSSSALSRVESWFPLLSRMRANMEKKEREREKAKPPFL